MKLVVPTLETADDEGFDGKKNIFSRKKYGENLFELIINTNDKLVIALDAPWGEGKTTFIKMWKGWLSKEKGIKSIG